jgi:hypothetical protein
MKNADLKFETFVMVDKPANGQNGERRRGKDINHELTRMNTNKKKSRQGPLPDRIRECRISNTDFRSMILM